MLNMQPQTDWYTTISPSGMVAATRPSSEEGGALGRIVVLYYPEQRGGLQLPSKATRKWSGTCCSSTTKAG